MDTPRTAERNWVPACLESPDDQRYARYLDSLVPSWYRRAEQGDDYPRLGRLVGGKPRSGLWILDATPLRPSQLDLPPGLFFEHDSPSTLETLDDDGVLRTTRKHNARNAGRNDNEQTD